MKSNKNSQRIIEVDLNNPIDVIEALMMIADRGSLSITCGSNMDWKEISKMLEKDGYKRFDSIGDLIDYIHNEFHKSQEAPEECEPHGCSCNCRDCECEGTENTGAEDTENHDDGINCEGCPIALLCQFCHDQDSITDSDDEEDDDEDDDDDDEDADDHEIFSILCRVMRQHGNDLKDEVLKYVKKQRKKTVRKICKYIDISMEKNSKMIINSINKTIGDMLTTQEAQYNEILRRQHALLDLVTPLATEHVNTKSGSSDKNNKEPKTNKDKNKNTIDKSVDKNNNK